MAQRILVGEVISHHCDKTAVVEVKCVWRHPLYNKNVTSMKRFLAHDPKNEFQPGAVVRIRESRPISKTKKWVVMGNVKDFEEKQPLPMNHKEDAHDTDANAS